MTDFRVVNHGSVVSIVSQSAAAKAFAENNFFVEPWQGTPNHFTTDHRVAWNLAERLMEEGWTVG